MRKIILILLVLCLASCVRRLSGPSWCAEELPIGAITIAYDAVDLLVATYPPGHTCIYLEPAQSTVSPENEFVVGLEAELRKKGFCIATSPTPEVLTLAYTLDTFQGEPNSSVWYLQLRLSDGKTFARSYSSHGLPEAGLSRGDDYER